MEKIDIALISETRLTPRSYITFKNYTTYRTDHPSGNSHGGTAVIVRKNIKHYALNPYKTDKIQATMIKLNYKNSDTTIAAVYCPPRHSISAEEFKTFFAELGPTFISGGDWNSKHTYWGSRLINPKGRQLHKATVDMNLDCISHGEPTYWPKDLNKIPDLLDFYITKNISRNYTKIEKCEDLSSDHSPVILNQTKVAIPSEPSTRIYNQNTDWDKYKEIIAQNLELNIKLKTTEDIENSIEKFNYIIHMAAIKTTPTKNTNPPHRDYPKKVIMKALERRKLRKEWHRTRYPSDKTKLNRASEELKKMISDYENLSFQNYLTRLTPNKDTNYSLWRATKNLKRPVNHIPPIKKRDNTWARSNYEKATAFAVHLRDVFTPLETRNEEKDKEIRDFLQSPNQLCLPLRAATPKEISREIITLPTGKAPGYDQIDSTLIKNLPKKGIMFLVMLFNSCLRLSHFPSQWKIAQVVMVPKPGKPVEETLSYRPISLLPLLGKLFEQIILNRMYDHLEEILPEHQFGFRQKHGTIEQVHRISNTISQTIENKQFCSAVFLDISQAFDRVWHMGLLYKIKNQLPHSFYSILASYLNKRCFEVKVQNETSELYDISSGVPQGSILGPVLYLIFTADIPKKEDTMIATYADDTAILSVNTEAASASATLQRHLIEIEEWLGLWRIKANNSKSVHVTFTLRKGDCPPVTLNGEQIPHSDNVKYLGMHLDRRLTWKSHIWTKRKQLDTKFRSLYWLVGKKSQLSNESKMLIYKAILKPIWTYGIELWGTASSSNIDILERFQTKSIRCIYNIPKCISNKYILRDLNLNTVKQEISIRSSKYQTKLSNHVNASATKLTGTGSVQHSRLRRNSVPSLKNRFSTL